MDQSKLFFLSFEATYPTKFRLRYSLVIDKLACSSIKSKTETS